MRTAALLLIAIASLCACGSSSADESSPDYVNPDSFLNIPFGTHSHWAQPWRAYARTVPASVFVNGTGINFNVDAPQAADVAQMLARYGIHHARIEVGWGDFDYFRQDTIDDPSIAIKLGALQRNGIRPLIVLNSNSGVPCPMLTSRVTVAIKAASGDRTLTLETTKGLVPGYSGLSESSGTKVAARLLIEAIKGNSVRLSQPLSASFSVGAVVPVATLKYRPFSVPGTTDYKTTMAGWQSYVVNVANAARTALGTVGKADGGFDLEVWNELTFGSEFLSINNYYSPALVAKPEKNWAIWGPIVEATAVAAHARPDLFSGVIIADGFANTVPWPASATEPEGVGAIDKHPYQPRLTFPAAEEAGTNLNADMQPDTYVPAYSALFPEFDATAIRTETLVRDMGPFSNTIYGTLHGESARNIRGQVVPVSTWITEANISPTQDDPSVSRTMESRIKAKAVARYFTFFLNKGVSQVDLYAVRDADTGMGLVQDNFLSLADQAGQRYPADDKSYVSPSLLVTGRIVAQMSAGLDRSLTNVQPLTLYALSDANAATIFKGDGTGEHPDLRAVDVFAFLPFQVHAKRLIIPYYVMTHDIMKNWPDDIFSVTVSGFLPTARFSLYDPFTDTTASVTSTVEAHGIRLRLPTIDYPRLLIVDE